jgi:hypothetical protein
LNWKGRLVERAHAIRAALRPKALFRAVVRYADSRLGVASRAHLNWKGRLVERAHALRRTLRTLGPNGRWADAAFRAVNSACFSFYWLSAHLRRRTRVKSVLHLSILSHKPFMLSRVLRELGLRSDYFALNVDLTEGILNVGWDYAMRARVSPMRRRVLECFYLWTVLARYDVIHSHFKTMLSHTGWEFEYLRRLGKVVVFHFRGCDVRHRSLNMRLQPELNCCQECEYPVGSCDTDYQHSQLALTRKYGDTFFVTTPDLVEFAAGSEHIPFIHPTGIDFDAIVAVKRDPALFRIVTSSNHHGIDGTRFIRAAVERLRSEGRAVELIEVSNTKYRDALATYKSADVFVGKLRMGYYNNGNIETMMLGVPNMSYIREEFRALAPDCPIIVTTPDTVYERLQYYIDHRDELRAIGARGPEFVKAQHDPAKLVRRMIDRYNVIFATRSLHALTPRPPAIVPLVRKDLTPVATSEPPQRRVDRLPMDT